jgi:hypothetical protein
VLDYGDVIVHVFIDDARAYYDLDRLWSKAPRIQVPPPLQVAVNDDSSPALFARRRSR